MTEPTPETGITPDQVRVAAQVGVELLMSETTVIPTSKMEAGVVLRAVLAQVAAGNAMIVSTVPPEAPPAPEAPKAPKAPARKKAPRKARPKRVKS